MKTPVAFRLFAAVVSACLLVVSETRIQSADHDISATAPTLPEGNVRDKLFTDEWRFSKGDEMNAADPSFDDTAWCTLDLPHDWSVEASFDLGKS